MDNTAFSAGFARVDITPPLVDFCVARSADAAVEAVADLRPASLSFGRSVARRISFVRCYLMKNGKVQTNPGTNNPDIVRPVGTADETVQVLRIDREGAKPICLINFQTHPDVVGGETITADWPGLTRRVFEAATMGEALCLVVNGAQGDVNHCNVLPLPGELNGLRRDFDAVDRGYAHARHMANVLAGSALGVWLKCAPIEAGAIRFLVGNARVPANKARDDDEKNLAWANEVWALHEAGRDAEISAKRGYFPFSDSYRQGGYEAATSPFGPSVADDLIAEQLRQLRELHAPKGRNEPQFHDKSGSSEPRFRDRGLKWVDKQ